MLMKLTCHNSSNFQLLPPIGNIQIHPLVVMPCIYVYEVKIFIIIESCTVGCKVPTNMNFLPPKICILHGVFINLVLLPLIYICTIHIIFLASPYVYKMVLRTALPLRQNCFGINTLLNSKLYTAGEIFSFNDFA